MAGNLGDAVLHFKGDSKDLDKTTSKVASGVKSAFKVATGAIIGATTAVAGLVGASVKAYAEFEQLEGGIQKLYGDSADKLMEYANNAYKTVGMSANQYMSATTAFSAKLLSDFGGDASKAADYADKAMAQIADNANTYGKYTTEELTLVYQNLSKGIYTTLDNLNLGFGGSKEGMQELLDKAEELSGVHYNIENFSDIVDAIQVVQDNLKISGTTANEAAKTISGSLNMTKAAWTNLITGLSNKNADMGKLVTDFITSAETLLKNLLPVVEQALGSIVDVLPGLIDKLVAMLPGLLERILPVLIQSAIGLLNGLVNALPKIIPVLMDGVIQAIKGLVKILPVLIDAVLKGTIMIIQALAETLPDLLPEIVDAILQIIPILIDNLPLFIKAGAQLIIGLAQGLIQSIPKLLTQAWNIIKSLTGYFNQLPGMLVDIGKNLIIGLWNGIVNYEKWIINKIKSLGSTILKSIKSIFGVHSPSTEFEWIGKMNMVGFEKGMEGMKSEVQDTIDSMFNLQPNISGAMSSTYSPNMVVNVQNNMEFDPLGQVVNRVKTFSGGAKNDYNWGAGL